MQQNAIVSTPLRVSYLRGLVDGLVCVEAGLLVDVSTLILLLVHRLLYHHHLENIRERLTDYHANLYFFSNHLNS